MTGFVLILLFGVAVMSLVFYLRARKMEASGETPLLGFDSDLGGTSGTSAQPQVTNLKMGDIVSHFGSDYMVEGRLDYDEEGWTWTTYMLVDGEDVKWLAVEEDDRLEVSLWEELDDLDVSGPRPPEFIEYQGDRFKMVEWGEARVNQTGKTGRKTGLNMEYFEYEGPDDRYLSVEKWGNEIEASIGEEINPVSLEIFPAAGT